MNDKTDIEILLVNKTQVVKQLATIEMINSKVNQATSDVIEMIQNQLNLLCEINPEAAKGFLEFVKTEYNETFIASYVDGEKVNQFNTEESFKTRVQMVEE